MSRKAYETFTAVKRHFESAEYDYFKYHGKCRMRPYEKIGNQKFAFDKLGRRFGKDFAKVIAVSFLHQVPIKWVGDLDGDDVQTAWRSHQKYIQSGTRVFKIDVEHLVDTMKKHNLSNLKDLIQPRDEMNLPAIDQMRLSGLIEPETCAIIDSLTSYSTRVKCQNPLWDESRMLILKFNPFIRNIEKKPFAMLLRNAISEI